MLPRFDIPRLAAASATLAAALLMTTLSVAPAAQPGPYLNESDAMLPLFRKWGFVACSGNAKELTYGDIVLYRHPKSNALWFKMVAAVAGDTVEIRRGVLRINGKYVPRNRISDFATEIGKAVPQFEETLPNGSKILVLDAIQGSFVDNVAPSRVPADHVFVLGTNRDNSIDSASSDHGPVPIENAICKLSIPPPHQ